MSNTGKVNFVKYNLEELESAKNELSNLLAVIHADGGHYEAEHGISKAVKDAKDKVLIDRSDLSEIRSAFRLHFAVAPDDPLIITVPEKELFRLNAPMPCGHAARYVYPPDGDSGTTRWCVVCELQALQKWIPFLKSHGVI